MTVYERIRRLILDSDLLKPDDVKPETQLEQLGDSFGLIELIMLVEEEFNIEIPDDQAETIYMQAQQLTLGQLAVLIERWMHKPDGS